MADFAVLDSRAAYTMLVALVAGERAIELTISSRNAARAFARGGVEAGRANYAWMVPLHALFLLSCPAEVWLLDRPWTPAIGVPSLVLVAASMALRYWVVRALAGRWTTRVVFVPGDPLVSTGPFRHLRHPNYLAVAVEIAALPLVHGAWLTAAFFSGANAVVLARRISVENRLLDELAGPNGPPRRTAR
jgi:methyltransferase